MKCKIAHCAISPLNLVIPVQLCPHLTLVFTFDHTPDEAGQKRMWYCMYRTVGMLNLNCYDCYAYSQPPSVEAVCSPCSLLTTYSY